MENSLIEQKIYNKTIFPWLKRIKNSPTGQRIEDDFLGSMADHYKVMPITLIGLYSRKLRTLTMLNLI